MGKARQGSAASLVQSGNNPFLAPGTRIFAQFLYRELSGSSNLATTPAVKFDICP